jgi:hypothetical protein
MATRSLTGGPHTSAVLVFKINPKSDSTAGKKLGNKEKSGKIVGVGNPIWNTFNYCNFFQNSMDFKIFKRF